MILFIWKCNPSKNNFLAVLEIRAEITWVVCKKTSSQYPTIKKYSHQTQNVNQDQEYVQWTLDNFYQRYQFKYRQEYNEVSNLFVIILHKKMPYYFIHEIASYWLCKVLLSLTQRNHRKILALPIPILKQSYSTSLERKKRTKVKLS